ncbi:MAG: hypothetical protein K1060chlam5_00665 [Candidatus Anoxychlamydiales bacterium]|nr:hypothetical protein [Candidatus Anoxychlamydiales bacterium]
MRKTFCFKLYTSKKNKFLHNKIDIGSQIYNYCISLHKRYYRLYKKHLNKYQLQKHLTKAKKRYPDFKNFQSQALQDITDRIDRAYLLFFKNLKNKVKTSPPNFKKKKRYKSFTLKQAGYKLIAKNKILIDQKIYNFFASQEIDGVIKTLTIKRDPIGDLYIFFSVDVIEELENKTMSCKTAGFDFGLKTFLTSSEDEEDIKSPLFFKKTLKKIKKLNQSFSRKKRGSSNRKKALMNLFRVHKKIFNQRKDFHFKLAKDLSEKYVHLFFENLDIKALQKLYGRKISDLSFSNFLKILEYYQEKKGSKIIYIDRFYPSSKTCYHCNNINADLTLKDRTWICPHCKKTIMRDKNAARNIKRQGIVLWNRENKTRNSRAIPA